MCRRNVRITSLQASLRRLTCFDSYTIALDKTLSAILPPRSALALHVGDASSSPSSPGTKTTVLFGVEATTALSENIYVVGSTPELGGWDPSKAVSVCL